MSRQIQRHKAAGRLFIGGSILPSLVLLLGVIALPALFSVVISVTDMDLGTPLAKSKFVGFSNYVRVGVDPDIVKILFHSVWWTVFVLGMAMGLGLATALMLNSFRKHGGKLLVLWLLPWIMPDVAAAMVWMFLLHPDIGALNFDLARLGIISGPKPWLSDPRLAMWGVIIAAAWRAFPFHMTMSYAALQTLPDEHRDAALIDGTNAWQFLRYVQLPWMKPVLSITSLLGFIWTFNWFSLIWGMTRGGPGISTATIPIHIYKRSMVYFDFSRASAFSVISLFFLSIFIVIYIRNVYKKGNL